MQVNRCIGCMEETAGYPCSHCGFDGRQYRRSPYALSANTILHGRYLLGRVLGKGGFGITYIGWDLAAAKKVAIKEFYPSGHANRHETTGATVLWNEGVLTEKLRNDGIESFRREGKKMERLSNVAEVASVYEVFEENSTVYIVMEYIQGGTLKSLLETEGRMSWARAQQIFIPVIEAMEKVHNAGLIHRDLSPDNLMITPGGGVKILDLGAAKDLSVNSGASSMVVAKSGFSPLEQYGQRGSSGPWTDIYALAATIYYALTGALPPVAIDRLDNDTLNWEHPAMKQLPGYAVGALKHAMNVTLSARTQSMGEFLSELRGEPKREVLKPGMADTGATEPVDVISGSYRVPGERLSDNRAEVRKPGNGAAAVQTPPVNQFNPNPPVSPAKRKKKSPLPAILIGLAGVVVLVAVLVITTSTCMLGHSWDEATCLYAKTCSRCGETEGEALGHLPGEATCSEPATCSRCGVATGFALGHKMSEGSCTEPKSCIRCGYTETVASGHDWAAATSSTPRTCTICGATEGKPTGCIPVISGYGSSIPAAIGPSMNYYLILDQTVRNCRQMTLDFTIVEARGWYQGGWRMYVRDLSGSWKDVGGFDVEPDSTGRQYLITFTFDQPISFEAIATAQANLSGASWSSAMQLLDVYTAE